MEGLRPPDALVLAGNVAENWRKFKQRLELYLEATESEDKQRTEKRKAAILLHVAGPEAVEVFNTFTLTEEEKGSYSTLLRKFEDYCTPKCNETYERYVFRSRMQSEGECFESFYRDLQLKAQSCNFSTLSSSLIRDQIVYGVWDKKLRERLLREDKLTLEQAVQICKASELTEEHKKAWENTGKLVEPVVKQKSQERGRKCGKCNRRHEPRKCPAYQKICHKCKKKNHFAVCCKLKTSEGIEVEASEGNSDFEILEVHPSRKSEEWVISAMISGKEIQLKVDTGSQANLLPLSLYKKISGDTQTKPDSSILRSYSGDIIGHMGTAQSKTEIDGFEAVLEYYVVRKSRRALLGLHACKLFGLVNCVEAVTDSASLHKTLVARYPKLFRGIGCVRKEYKVVLQEGATPVIQAARRVPHLLKKPLKKEVDRLEAAGIITRMDEPSDWVSPLVVVRKKNGHIRVCMDPRHINSSLKREHFALPRREDIEAELAGATVF